MVLYLEYVLVIFRWLIYVKGVDSEISDSSKHEAHATSLLLVRSGQVSDFHQKCEICVQCYGLETILSIQN